jgi:predicted nucleotidyltransferase
MTVDDKLIAALIKRILAVAKPQRIILFGSAATGTMTDDSDIDLLVLEHDFGDPRAESTRLRRALGSLGIPADVFAMTPERFDETKDVFGGLAYPAHKYGRVIYEAA